MSSLLLDEWSPRACTRRIMFDRIMVDHCKLLRNRNRFKEVFGRKNKINEYSKNTKKLSKFLSHNKISLTEGSDPLHIYQIFKIFL